MPSPTRLPFNPKQFTMKPKFTFLLLAMILITLNVFSQQSITYYVSAARGNDQNLGNSPGQAFRSLRQAVNLTFADNITDHVTILVEKGTYYPYNENGDISDIKAYTFVMFRHPDAGAGKSLRILGGYDFTSGTRDIVNNPTILDGGRTTASGGVDHVITLGLVDQTADSLVIEGFTVTGAAQRGAYGVDVIKDRLATGSTTGGGMTVVGCTSDKISIRNCIFTDNVKWWGGAVAFKGTSGINFQNCVFSNNIAGWDGSQPGSGSGGAFYFAFSGANFLNCIFHGNNGNAAGAVAYIANDELPQTVKFGNCTFTGNSSSDGNLITSVISGKVQITNSIIWQNDADRLHLQNTYANPDDPASGDNFIAYNIREFSSYIPPYSYRASPDFRDINNPKGPDGKWFTADDGLQIISCSITPALDSGNNNYGAGFMTRDILGRPRIHNGTIDFGPYEDQSPLKNFYRDIDGDGFGSGATTYKFRCVRDGYSAEGRDCDDNDNAIHPGAQELCGDGKDNNCNGVVDGDATLVLNVVDKDGDGFGDSNAPFVLYCELRPGYVSNGLDCDDNNKDINPNAVEICDGLDNNCNQQTDEGVATAYYIDADGDGYGNSSSIQYSCTPIDGLVTQGGDCDDTDKTIYPGATEICDNKDNNCDGQTDEGLAKINYYLDADGDGFGKTGDVIQSCSPIEGRVTKSGDCNDSDNTIYPGAPEICDGKDNDCDPKTNDPGANGYYPDADGDGHGKFTTAIISCTPLEGYSTRNDDCNDNDNTIYPGAPELCDSKDNDCNGKIDDMQMQKLFLDADGDGYGNPLDVILSCSDVEGRVLDNSDCNDNDKDIHPFAPELCDGKDNNCNGQTDENAGVYYYADADGDGFGNNNDFTTSCTPVEGRVTKGNDCNDNDKTIYPGATEICDNKDNDCDGQTDEGLTKINYYLDADGDGYGKTSDVVQSCTSVAGRVTKGGDCNDNDKTIYPNAPERCDGKDNDCDGKTDEGFDRSNYYLDADGDGYGNDNDVVKSCAPIAGRVTRRGDCNDNDKTIYPNAPELCDGKDNDCDGRTDEGIINKTSYYLDADGDGFGRNSDVVQSCTPVSGRVTKNGDCNDNDPTVYPGAAEVCDNKDNDCDGQTDEGFAKTLYYRDTDADGFGSNVTVEACTPPAGYSTKTGDCDDNDKTIYPGAPELCDGKDNDCNGQAEPTVSYYLDADGDGFGKTSDVVQSCTPIGGRVTRSGDCNDGDINIYPGATEICDGKDNDCDGQIDETKTNYYIDNDGDGFGNPNTLTVSCTPRTDRVTKAGDCNDNDKNIYPGAPEICDNKDNDCDGQIDEGVKTAYYRDADGDGYGKNSDVVASCTPLTGRVTRGGDCNDNDRTINPGVTEVLGNSKDDDCDGLIDEGGCVNPGTLSTTNITRTTAVLRWTATTNPTQWQVRYRRTGGAWVTLISVPGGARSYEVRNFSCNTSYEWQVRSICGTTPNQYDKTAFFTTNACATATRSATTTNESSEEVIKTQVETKAWPNPTHGSFTLSVKLDKTTTQTASIKMIDMAGRVVYQENTTIANGQLQKQMNMPAGLGAGLYIVMVTTGENTQQFKIEYFK